MIGPVASGCLLAMLLVLPVRAHTLSVAHLDIDIPASGAPLRMELDVRIRDLALTLPLDENRDQVVTWGELTATRAQINAWVGSGLVLSTRRGNCVLRPAGLGIRHYDDGVYATLQLSAACPSTDNLRIGYTLLMDRDPQHRALITVRRVSGVVSAIARSGTPWVLIPQEKGDAFSDFLREGIHHILIGYDHLAFLLSLLLPAALTRVNRQWLPTTDLRRGFKQVFGIVTAFTLAHSITLSLAALGWVTPASRWVEVALAASVLMAALNNLKPLVTRRLWVVSFLFGLIHGFGFAGAVGELGLPDGDRLLALLGFNLGVEAGQIAVVCVLLPLLWWCRHQRWYSMGVLPAASLGIAARASWWLWQRLVA